jgi:hypothetical protein
MLQLQLPFERSATMPSSRGSHHELQRGLPKSSFQLRLFAGLMLLPGIPASVLLWKQEIESGEKLERRQASAIVIDGNLRLDRSIHNNIANLEDLPKTHT